MKNLLILIPSRIPDSIKIMAEDNVTLETILDRYEDWGNTILLNGMEKPLTTVIENNDMVIILNKTAKGDAVKSPQ